MTEPSAFDRLRAALAEKTATAGIIGLGYVGLPLAAAAGRGGFRTLGFDIDPAKTVELNAGRSYIEAVSAHELKGLVEAGRFEATADFARLSDCDVVVICVPTPLDRHREPDLSYIEATGRDIAAALRPGQLVVLESTTYPGTTREVLKPILEATGLVGGRDFFLGFSPEREDPGNSRFETVTIPKVVAGDGPEASALVQAFYGAVVKEVVPVSSPDVAEAVKITENVFRAVNIALVNELKVIYEAMGIDVWEVIEAAKTKPFGFMPFYPGPGLGGHCIPIDPFYLSWRSREFEVATRFIELAGEINTAMPARVVEVLARALDQRHQKALSAARVLVLGLAYKKNVRDVRESPSFKLMHLLEDRGAKVDFHDPHVDQVPPTREHAEFTGRVSAPLTTDTLKTYDAVLIATDHDAVDYTLVAEAALVVDTRNAMAARGLAGANVVKA
ncbi:nucleotide sugar dehydrogenase [Phenylobacterium soli]|uniref:Nucleotide sugar dehydrogenase n=1 Tax=Phenylobacterium soli TaxID=2170551 RepID=A0A328ARD8_9CAUL|nr:nucleotide sugar dehydrogenase [Phenylobacterium soli]RAK56094.1 nucleotide sugar dehydrogenase [Phenylobacterium soli]